VLYVHGRSFASELQCMSHFIHAVKRAWKQKWITSGSSYKVWEVCNTILQWSAISRDSWHLREWTPQHFPLSCHALICRHSVAGSLCLSQLNALRIHQILTSYIPHSCNKLHLDVAVICASTGVWCVFVCFSSRDLPLCGDCIICTNGIQKGHDNIKQKENIYEYICAHTFYTHTHTHTHTHNSIAVPIRIFWYFKNILF
jgi:hypothetical protein